ncbi:UNVERIFIED_CONTAM: Beta-galactosidase 17 [Sesamum latifolium]|uniref:Beta-galactosidase n=1 Tax=Sesamum latifolium TaxID=2727402 RepID=A0AAW2UFT1_9LAMI
MARNGSLRRNTAKVFIFLISLFVLGALAPLPSVSQRSSHFHFDKVDERKFEIARDMFWKDGEPFRIIGGDLHYFRVHPEYWEDRLLRAKALGLNAIQTYVPWNLHEPRQGHLVFEGIADIISFLKLCKKLDLLVMLRAGPYICGVFDGIKVDSTSKFLDMSGYWNQNAFRLTITFSPFLMIVEWDLGGFPAWLLAEEPAIRLRSSDPAFLDLVEKWWGILLPKIYPLLYSNGGPIIMVQIENEFGSYGNDKAYLHYLVKLARGHLGDDILLYTTDGGARETLRKGTIPGDAVFSAVDFTTGDDPWPIFKLQKEFNAPGKSPPLSAEFYTGWLTHWGEKIASTDATFTATYLEKILSMNGSAILYMAHGGTNFGFYSGANTGSNEADYKPDLTSYDYDAPIRESGDVDNAKYKALRRVIAKYSTEPLASVPPDNEKIAYGRIKLDKVSFLYDMIGMKDLVDVVESENPISMEAIGQMFGFVLYASEYNPKGNGSVLFIPKVENMGRLNYGPYIFDRKGILSSVYLDSRPLYKWKMLPIPLQNLNEATQINPIILNAQNFLNDLPGKNCVLEPAFYTGHFSVDKVGDTYISFRGWSKGIAFVNEINIGRFWPSVGPQCNLYVPAPMLRQGENTLVILELESPNTDLFVSSVDHPDFTCGPTRSTLRKSREHRLLSS